jgi:hypothetical protein
LRIAFLLQIRIKIGIEETIEAEGDARLYTFYLRCLPCLEKIHVAQIFKKKKPPLDTGASHAQVGVMWSGDAAFLQSGRRL